MGDGTSEWKCEMGDGLFMHYLFLYKCIYNHFPDHDVIVTSSVKTKDLCNSTCETCLTTKCICKECFTVGHTTTDPFMRACTRCISASVKCVKLLVIVEAQDYAPIKNQMLDQINEKRKNGGSPLPHLRGVPDPLHFIKKMERTHLVTGTQSMMGKDQICQYHWKW